MPAVGAQPRDHAARYTSHVSDQELLDAIASAVDECAGGDHTALTVAAFNASDARAAVDRCPAGKHAAARLRLTWRGAARAACQRTDLARLRSARPAVLATRGEFTFTQARSITRLIAARLGRPISATDFELECQVLEACDRRRSRRHRLGLRFPTRHQAMTASGEDHWWAGHMHACGLKTRGEVLPVMTTAQAIDACVEETGAMPISTDLERWATARGARFSDWDSRRWQSHVAAADRARAADGRPPLPPLLPLARRPRFGTVVGEATGKALLGKQEFTRPYVVDAVAQYLLDELPAAANETGFQGWADRQDGEPHYRAVALHGGLPALLPDARRVLAAGGPDRRFAALKRRLARVRTPDLEALIRFALEHPHGFTAAQFRALTGQHYTRVSKTIGTLREAGALHDRGRSTTSGSGRPMLFIAAPGLETVVPYIRPAREAPPVHTPKAFWTTVARDTFTAAQTLPAPFRAPQLARALGIPDAVAPGRLKHLQRLGAAQRSDKRVGNGYLWTLAAGFTPPAP